MSRSKVWFALVLLGLLGTVAVISFTRARARRASELLPYQGRVRELPVAEQKRFEHLQASIRYAERVRSSGSMRWPAALGVPGLAWTQRGHGLYVNYLGVPAETDRLRWLVLFIEPEPTALKDPAPPEDEEHHTLGDGTGIHVSIWTAPNQGPVPEVVLPFPAGEGWTQRLAR